MCIALTMAALHDLEVKEAEVLNTHVTAPNREKISTGQGTEFGIDAGKSAIIAKHYMIKRVEVLHLEHILHNVCRIWLLVL